MKKIILPILIFVFILLTHSVKAQNYNIVWTSQSQNSSESMPCGGGDIGLNVWVENGDVLFYIARSGQFDENNSLLKSGRVRIRFSPNPFTDGKFRQELNLNEGCVIIKGEKNGKYCEIKLWADVFNPVINVEVSGNQAHNAEIYYENWRYADRALPQGESDQSSWKWAAPKNAVTKKDIIDFEQNKIVFYHQNQGQNIFDITVAQQGMESVRNQMFNPLENLIFGACLEAKNFIPAGVSQGKYIDSDFKAWKLQSTKALKIWNLTIKLHSEQTANLQEWKNNLDTKTVSNKKQNLEWWRRFWERSFIRISGESIGEEISRNYALFRYMLACNAYGSYPSRFNGGLHTFDPVFVDKQRTNTPDFRRWTGGTFTAQNQRLVYFPMLRSGDFDMMIPQFEFYNRILKNAELRSQVYWGHGGAAFTEQIENFGLPNFAEYGTKRPDNFDKGLEYNAWLEYMWDTSLEFCFMILETESYAAKNIEKYIPLIESCLRFFDEHYQYLAKMRGNKALDGNGKLVIFPGSAAETYKMAYNSTSTIAALKTVSEHLLALPDNYLDEDKRAYFAKFLQRLPEIRINESAGKQTISPAWLWERENNSESPQLYPVFPWGIYGVGKPDIQTAINTYNDSLAVRFRSHTGWKQDAIWAARLGLTDEAWNLTAKKLRNGKHRFPAFWGPGFDWTPDLNHGGSGMIALQEMLMQCDGDKIYLFPAWDKNLNVHFLLYAPKQTSVECELRDGKILKLNVLPKEREKDLINQLRITN
ncbi:MAG: DUF5703 domain-containing protein [Paludibacter sp.]|jgi:hypothetical protein|nr:DUF5703 domain-containing protein [Paludibacter sp.]